MTAISDPIHGYVKLDDLAQDLADTPEMQRLRWIKQLGLANLVYPGANHTRFEHSLGAFYLAGLLADHLGLDEEKRAEILAAALLHDVGHGPFSHATESVLLAYLKQDHENVIDLLRNGALREALDDHGLDPFRIQNLIRGGTHLGQIVSSEIDVDRMDYLMRDAHYTGVAYGVIDYQRLIEKMELYRGQLVIEAGGIHAAESLLVSRLLMYPTVYFHHVSRIAQSMIESGVRHLVEEEGTDPKGIKKMDDMELISVMTSAGGYPAEIVNRIKSRRLFKRAVYVGQESLKADFPANEKEGQIAEEIADNAGVDPIYVLVDNPQLPQITEGNVVVKMGQEIKILREVSPLVTIMERAHLAAWRFGVYTTPENKEKVRNAARRCLNIGNI
ncbi:MAG: HD domain-containing protein [Methanotrichaceae archaeon]